MTPTLHEVAAELVRRSERDEALHKWIHHPEPVKLPEEAVKAMDEQAGVK